MAITAEQMASLVDDSKLKARVGGLVLAATKGIRKENPKSTDYAAKVKTANGITQTSGFASDAFVLGMARVVLSEFWDTAKMTWNANPASGESNLVVSATDAEITAVIVAAWSGMSAA